MRFITMALALAACANDPVPTTTGATCPDSANPQFTWQNFGYDFFCHYCTNCHDSGLKIDQRNGAPLFHDLDTLVGVMEVKLHIDQQAAFGPKANNTFMPGAGTGGRCPSTAGGPLDEACPEPTDQERINLGVFLACEQERPQDYQPATAPDAGVSDHCAAYTGPH